jgi:hypothetical protein
MSSKDAIARAPEAYSDDDTTTGSALMGLFIYRFDILGKNLMPTFVQFTKYDKL